MRTVIARRSVLGGLLLLTGCLGTRDLSVGEFEEPEPPADVLVDAALPDAGSTPLADARTPRGRDEEEEEEREASSRAAPDASTLSDAAAQPDAGVNDAAPSDASSADAASDAGPRDAASDANHDAADGSGDSGRGSLLCTFEPWHC